MVDLLSLKPRLIWSDQCLGVELHSFTQYTRKDLICDRKKAYTPIVVAYRKVSLFQDRTQITKVSIAEHTFFQPYSADKLVHAPYQLIVSGLKQLSREAVGTGSLCVFESLYRNSDVMAGRRYLYPVVIDSLVVALMSPSPRNNVEKCK